MDSKENSFANNYNLGDDVDGESSASLTARLSSYKYLDDYEYYRGDRLKQNAMRKFKLIMQSIQTSYKNSSQMTFDNENDNDVIDEAASEFSNFNQILKRHRKRFKQNLNLHHHHR